ncbi:MAG: tRNA1(Val) (adenine(37)-N6)-methyltransferase [Bacilli bacterium]|nr:tRNA1(Val) (adenine(37)-N6)-methyltransferase [Bacilli bacterium]
MIVKNRLLNFGNKVIYQDNDSFLFSLDSVLLPNFVTVKLSDKKIIDLCCGNAPGPMLLSFKTKARIFGVEIQKDIYELGIKSIKENGMDEQITLINDDVKNLYNVFESESFDIVTCNPPYFKYKEDSLVNINDKKTIARHEMYIKLEEIIEISRYLLRNSGTFAMVHRPDRLIEIIEVMRKNNIEPKKIRYVYPKIEKEANMILIEGVKNGKSGLKILPPLITHDKDGNYCQEIKNMFGYSLDSNSDIDR